MSRNDISSGVYMGVFVLCWHSHLCQGFQWLDHEDQKKPDGRRWFHWLILGGAWVLSDLISKNIHSNFFGLQGKKSCLGPSFYLLYFVWHPGVASGGKHFHFQVGHNRSCSTTVCWPPNKAEFVVFFFDETQSSVFLCCRDQHYNPVAVGLGRSHCDAGLPLCVRNRHVRFCLGRRSFRSSPNRDKRFTRINPQRIIHEYIFHSRNNNVQWSESWRCGRDTNTIRVPDSRSLFPGGVHVIVPGLFDTCKTGRIAKQRNNCHRKTEVAARLSATEVWASLLQDTYDNTYGPGIWCVCVPWGGFWCFPDDVCSERTPLEQTRQYCGYFRFQSEFRCLTRH